MIELKRRPYLRDLAVVAIVAGASIYQTATPRGSAETPAVIAVWPGVPPGSEDKSSDETVRVTDAGEHVVSNVHRPTLTVYLPAAGRATGAGVVVMPGGGHRELWVDHEGHNVASWLRERGVAAFVLKYRLAREANSTYSIEEHAFRDAQRALRIVRSRAPEWQVLPELVGVMGFSAGGELAALTAMRHDAGAADAPDPISRQSSRPAFQALIYPGRSGDIVPTKESPPAFLACGFNDRADISEGLANVYLLFKKAGVQTELHVYSGVGHGFGLRARSQGPVAGWPQRFLEWLGERGFLAKAPKV
jgi:acetyl esterase/lipase